MNILDEYKKNSVKFCVHPPMEFLYAMYSVAKEDELNNVFEELNVVPEKEFKYLIHNIRNKLSKYLLGELKFFFQMTETIGHILPSFIMDNPEITDVKQLINIVEQADEKLIMFYLVKSVLIDNSLENNEELDWSRAKDDIGEMLSMVKYTIIKNSDIKDNLIECLENPKETKQRYCILINGFYEKAFLPVEKNILSKLETMKQNYEESFEQNPEEFFKRYFKMEVTPCFIHLSFFKHLGWFSYRAETKDINDWIILGAYSDRVFGESAVKERVDKLFKLLSDKRRVKIIELMSKRPWYGNELAEFLKLTPATVSYHIGFLIELDIVTFQRDEGRLYYSLNKQKMEEIFDDAKKFLLYRN